MARFSVPVWRTDAAAGPGGSAPRQVRAVTARPRGSDRERRAAGEVVNTGTPNDVVKGLE
jgi:hypothetical protein